MEQFAYIDIKTELRNASIPTTIKWGIDCFELRSKSSGEYILSLPKTIINIPRSGTIYEDKAILIRT